MRIALRAILIVWISACLPGCMPAPANPSFAIEWDAARDDLQRMREDPAELERPLLILAGYYDAGIVVGGVRRRLRAIFPDATIITVTFLGTSDFEECRDRVFDVAGRHLDLETTGVDVIGVSMGGVIARDAALPHEDGRRLDVRSLYTIGSPHRGARIARCWTFDRRVKSMRVGSPFLTRLDETVPDYPIVPYVRMGDFVIGPELAAPTWQTAPHWVPRRGWQESHIMSHRDPRILGDIARRLRGETPWTIEPRAPVPDA